MAPPDSTPPSASQYDADRSLTASSTMSPGASKIGSILLQERIRERKAEKERMSGSAKANLSNEPGPREDRPSERPRSHDGRQYSGQSDDSRFGDEVGAKQMSFKQLEEVKFSSPTSTTSTNPLQYISKIKKENFNLKLELFHRRQRAETFEAKLAEVEGLEEKCEDLEKENDDLRRDNVEQQSINEDLLREMQDKDNAVEEAVALICEHENTLEGQQAKINDLETKMGRLLDEGLARTRPGSGQGINPSIQSTSKKPEPASSHPEQPHTPPPPAERLQPGLPTSVPARKRGSMLPASRPAAPVHIDAPKNPHRPHFLQNDNPQTRALRSVYSMDGTILKSTHSLASIRRANSRQKSHVRQGSEETDNATVPSPRFSEFSEGDFESIYGARKPKMEGKSSAERKSSIKHQHISRPADRLSRSYSNQDADIGEWIQDTQRSASASRRKSPIQRQEKTFGSIGTVINKHTSPQKPAAAPSRRLHQPPPIFSQSITTQDTRPPESFAGPIFGTGKLPPTPDTMSTSHRGTNRSNPSIVTERSSHSKPCFSDFIEGIHHSAQKHREDGLLHDYPTDRVDDDPYLQDLGVAPRPPLHQSSDSSLPTKLSDRDALTRPRLNSTAAGRSPAASRAISYTASDSTARRRSTAEYHTTSPEKSLLPSQIQEQVYTPSDKSINGGVPVTRQSDLGEMFPDSNPQVELSKPGGKSSGSSAVARFFRRSSTQHATQLSLASEHQEGQSQLRTQARPQMSRDHSSNIGRRLSFQGMGKPSKMTRPRTSGGGEGTIGTSTDEVFEDDEYDEERDEIVADAHQGVGKGAGFAFGKRLAGLGRRGSRSKR